ncbi:CaCA family Na+/Ca+ antiporter [Natrinema pellirubrum DSM 15624]|uniref:CaCA family Na+/Ca+ antiporter n=1 Tax=Natrinema pellirubrum (strain DSM 15624 / CIP 106293 / JCM 10476 / NCIMB 786 / 157) TaxID=797303 RepID=L0JL44_NATP1|nr:calcium/sodium antiporter [Natrinema pellirubrum]AGB31282.1 K+dependent Na+ exchanger related-protein [Natrinema pellirubrum DSM 15624]ELY81780.1 CaCA family Na+/Ca+ antiporter [Natrinema pellirubrum DSM 15624]
MLPVGDVASLIVGVLALWFGARFLVTGASRIAGAAGISALVVGLTVVAFGTSAPEIVVSTGAALEGRGDVAVGNVVGSNVFNLGVILGLVAVIAPFRVSEPLLRRDVLAMAASTVVAVAVLANTLVSRLEGAVLLALLAGYLAALVIAIKNGDEAAEPTGDSSEATDGGTAPAAADGTGRDVRLGLEAGRTVAGLAIVIVGGRVLVDAAVGLALSVGISEWVVGATIVAAGTSLPELVTSVVAARQGDTGIAAGNVVGSSVFNVLGVLGLAAAARPLAVDPAVFLALGWLAAVTAFATVVLATGRQLTRLEGAALVAFGTAYWVGSAIL